MVANNKAGATTQETLFAKVPDWVILLLVCTVLTSQTMLSLREKSATWDEATHLVAGYLHLRFGDYRFNTEHPPLVKMLAAFPLLYVDVKMPPPIAASNKFNDWRVAHRFLYEENDADRLLFLSRTAVLPLALLLGCIVFLWTKELFGREAATFASLLYSLEPNMLAHGGLVHTDLGAACFMFLTLYGFYRVVHRVSIPHLALAGCALGLALVTKFSTLTLLPMLLILGIGVIVAPHPIELHLTGGCHLHVVSRPRKLLILIAAVIGMGIVGYVTIWASYRFRYEGSVLPGQGYEAPWDQLLPEQPWIARGMLWMKEARLLPEAYLYGLATVFTSTKRAAFLLGEISTDGWWSYFIVTFLLKTPLPLILLLALVPFALPFRRWWPNDWVALLFLLVPTLVYFGIASASRLNLGHRHILPIYPFLFALAGSVIPWAMRQRVVVQGGLTVLVAWYIFSSVSIFPHYLAYSNELTGGPEHGYKYLVDSNLDWGQDLKGLKRYMQGHGIERVWLSYFGTASPDYYGITYDYLPSYVIFDPKNVHDDLVRVKRLPLLRGTVAISATNLQGLSLPALGLNTDYFELYRQESPIAKIGYTIFIYRFD